MSEIKLLDSVSLLEDLPEENLMRGQIGAVVEIFADGKSFEVEFVGTDGKTYGLLALRPEQLMLLHHASNEEIIA